MKQITMMALEAKVCQALRDLNVNVTGVRVESIHFGKESVAFMAVAVRGHDKKVQPASKPVNPAKVSSEKTTAAKRDRNGRFTSARKHR